MFEQMTCHNPHHHPSITHHNPHQVLDRFPAEDYDEFPLPDSMVTMFSFPDNLKIKRAPMHHAPQAHYFSYVMTDSMADKVQISCIKPIFSNLFSRRLNKCSQARACLVDAFKSTMDFDRPPPLPHTPTSALRHASRFTSRWTPS